MSFPELKVAERDTTLTPNQLRAAGLVPATLYGKGVENKALQVRAHEFSQLYVQGKRQFKLTGYVDCVATVKQVQRDSVKQYPISIQFHQGESQSAGKNKASKQQAKAAAPVEAEAPQAEAVSV